MQLPGFLELSGSILQENSHLLQFYPGTIFSFPMMCRPGGQLADAMFLYHDTDQATTAAGRPRAWLLLDSLHGGLLQYTQCTVLDFVDTNVFPLDKSVDLTLAPALDEKTYTDHYNRLYTVYEQLRLFAFADTPDQEQQLVMKEYASLLRQLVSAELWPFYLALAPDFVQWLGLVPAPQQAQHESLQELPPADPPQDALPQCTQGTAQNPDNQPILDALQELTHLFSEKIATDAYKEAQLTRMHTELQSWRNGMIDSITQSMERDVIKLIDDIGRTVEVFRGQPPTRENYDRFFKLLEGVQTDLQDMLYRGGLEPYTVQGDAVDLHRQQILGTTPTETPALDHTVAQRHTVGWEKAGKVVRPERVTVYVYTDSDQTTH